MLAAVPRLIIPITLLLSSLSILTGCSSTKVVESWENNQYEGPSAKKIMVVGMIKDRITRRFFEQHFVIEAQKKGINIIPSYDLLTNPTDHDQREELVAAIEKAGVDGVLIAMTKGIEKKEGYVPSRLDWYPASFHHHGFYNYYYVAFRSIYRPGYIGSDKYLKMQMRYFDVASEQLLWAGNTTTKNPKSIKGTIYAIADEVLSDLRGSGLL